MSTALWNVQDLNEYIVDKDTSMKVLAQLERNRLIKFSGCGICSTVWEIFTQLDELFLIWDKFSGDHEYPVPSPLPHVSAGKYYARTVNKWDNSEYGNNRRELNQFCIDYLTEALK